MMNPHFFGDSNHPLFGVYHPARSRGVRRSAVLLCPPIGHEYYRTHWAIRMLAANLARQGHHVMRFDYLGIGDSAGPLKEVLQLDTWVDNVKIAARDLLDESGSDTLSIVGLRFGAALASLALADGLAVDRAVLWEPTWSGEEFLADLRAMHATMLDLWVCPMVTENSEQREEILGSLYSRSMLRAIQQFDLVSTVDSILRNLAIVQAKGPLRVLEGVQFATHSDLPDWSDLGTIETAWLPSESPTLIIEAIEQPTMARGSTLFNVPMPCAQPTSECRT